MLNSIVKNSVFWLLFSLILIFQFVIRVVPPQNYNFYFTTDQGNNAIFVREIVEYGRTLTKGPETSIPGVFAGPLWYYFLAPFYALFGGHPVAGIYALILLSLVATSLVIWTISKKITPMAGIIAGLALQPYWYFYELSRYEFNPFPVGILTIWQLFLLSEFLAGNKNRYFIANRENHGHKPVDEAMFSHTESVKTRFGMKLEDTTAVKPWSFIALIPIALALNCAVAAACAMFLLHLAVGLWAIKKKVLDVKSYTLANFVIPAILASQVLLQLFKQFSKSSLASSEALGARGFFSGTNFPEIALRFSEIFERSIIPQDFLASAALVLVALYLFWKEKQRNKFVLNFVILTGVFWIISFIFFGSNRAWREWHTIYLYLLTFLSFVFVTLCIPKKFGLFLLGIVLLAQGALFQERYKEYLKASGDPGILVNQLAVLDWIYTNNEGDGFNIYTFSPQVYDFQNQYLFWWYGRKTYGFVPCEYTLYPNFLKHSYVPHPLDYTQPTLGCDNLRFLIVEPGGNQNSYNKWREHLKFERGEKVNETEVGLFKIEKWKIRPRT